MSSRPEYETDPEFEGRAYKVKDRNYAGMAWYILGWEIQPDEDTEWTGIKARTGKVVAVMAGDDHRSIHEFEDFQLIKREEYCGECGQIGCTHDGIER